MDKSFKDATIDSKMGYLYHYKVFSGLSLEGSSSSPQNSYSAQASRTLPLSRPRTFPQKKSTEIVGN